MRLAQDEDVKKMTLRIASYNIHGWVDADMESNLERVAEVVNLQDPDILCLQVKCPVSPVCLCLCYCVCNLQLTLLNPERP